MLCTKKPCTHLKLKGDQAFAVAGPKLWNSLPRLLREVSSLNVFNVEVKNYFLSLAFERVGWSLLHSRMCVVLSCVF